MKILEKANKKTDLEVGDLICWTEKTTGSKEYRLVIGTCPYYATVLLNTGVVDSKFDSLKQLHDFYSTGVIDFKIIKSEDLQLIF